MEYRPNRNAAIYETLFPLKGDHTGQIKGKRRK
jgi:hypothetical protein